MDADIGVKVCGLTYMKGHKAHAGFPEISYGPMADKIVNAGYKVARVEQTETPDQMKLRKKQCKGKNAPKVVNREVCSIMTMGTRTYCYLDVDANNGLLGDESSSATNNNGPLLAIREVLVDSTTSSSDDNNGDEDDEKISGGDDDDINNNNDDDDDDSAAVKPACEYGITLVDAVRGSVTIGQFADDVLRSRMNTLLTAFSPSEVCNCNAM